MKSPFWIKHEFNYGWVCSECGYHGKTVVGRRIHESLSWPESCKTWKEYFKEEKKESEKVPEVK
jgi:hypothetical protein